MQVCDTGEPTGTATKTLRFHESTGILPPLLWHAPLAVMCVAVAAHIAVTFTAGRCTITAETVSITAR